jgi:DNA-binding transcriptional ArsR family regulator
MSRLNMVGQLMTTTTRTLSTDTALRLLADQQRRRVLRLVANGNGTTTADQLVDSLRTNTSRSGNQGTTRDQLAIALHHVRLSMLKEAGVIEYAPESETIQYHSIDIVEELLQVC